jgi:hypothetical protein
MSHVFIPYNQADADFAAVMMMTLEKAEFDTWLDKGRLRPGADWSGEIDKGILSAFALVLVISPDSRTSEYVTYEWSFVLGAGVPIVPVLRRETEIHPQLQRLQYLDFRGSVRPWDDLVRELKSLKDAKMTRWTPPRDTPHHIQRAILALDSASDAERFGAINVLAESDHEIARIALRHALTHPFRDVRGLAAIQLGEIKDDVIVSDIGLRALKDALACHMFGRDEILKAQEIFARIGRPAYAVLVEAIRSPKDPARYEALIFYEELAGKDELLFVLQGVDPDKTPAGRAIAEYKRGLR